MSIRLVRVAIRLGAPERHALRGPLLMVALALLTVAGCQAAGTGPPPGGQGNGAPNDSPNVLVEVSEWAVRPNPGVVQAGNVSFGVRNLGPAQQHELVVLRTELSADDLIMEIGASQVDEEASGRVSGYVASHQLPPGGTATESFNLSPGQYVLLCNLPGHYEAGMRAQLTINEAGGDP